MRGRCISAETALATLILIALCSSHPTNPRQHAHKADNYLTTESEPSTVIKAADFVKSPQMLKPALPAGPIGKLAVRASESSVSSVPKSPLPNSLSDLNSSTPHSSYAFSALGDPPDPAVLEIDDRKLDFNFYSTFKTERSESKLFAAALVTDIASLMHNTHSVATDRFPVRNYRFCDRRNHPRALCFASYDMNDNMTFADMSVLGELFQVWTGEWVEEDVPGCHMLFSSIAEPVLIRLAMAVFDAFAAESI